MEDNATLTVRDRRDILLSVADAHARKKARNKRIADFVTDERDTIVSAAANLIQDGILTPQTVLNLVIRD